MGPRPRPRDARGRKRPRRLRVCRDPDDDRILEAAVGGHADYVVTGDVDLLHLEGFRTTK
ncbi:MAG: putative toxin-antitoxin system toxin component, PIN family, partial [Candidatus Aminicenantes bacterium]|nr:putative toxin-antitoxin system toxin component, PIN family [Candidatus Aminicenantes bacterium]